MYAKSKTERKILIANQATYQTMNHTPSLVKVQVAEMIVHGSRI